jgi:hypothetical protein
MRIQARTLLTVVPTWLSVVCLIAAAAWFYSAAKTIAAHNKMSSRLEKPALPIDSLPRRPVMQLEFVRGANDVRSILQVDSAAQSQNVADVRAGNDYDTRHLILRYAILLIVLTLLVSQGSKTIGDLVFLSGVVMVLLIAAADFWENVGIARILDSPANDAVTGAASTLVSSAAFVKWVLLALLLIYLGVIASLSRTWRRWLTPVLFIAGVLLLAIVSRHSVERFLTPAPPHSGRSASMTSTRDARAAGTSAASTAATTRIVAAAMIGTTPGMRTSSM